MTGDATAPRDRAGLQSTLQAGALTLTLARPERGNALDPVLVEGLIDAVDSAAAQADVHTLVFRGVGRHFCTGFDLTNYISCSDGDLLLRLARIEMLLDRVYRAPLRTIAYATGRTWGAGADIFCACDHRIAHPDATFRFPGAQFGLVLGTRRLARRMGEDRARRTVIDGTTLPAQDALEAGLATALASDFETWQAKCGPPAVDRATLAALHDSTRSDDGDRDLAALVRSAAGPGLRERIAAYVAKLKQK